MKCFYRQLIMLALCLMQYLIVYSQNLHVELSPDKSKVDRSTNSGIATIFFDSNIEDLNIMCTDENSEEPIFKTGKKLWFTHIDVKKDLDIDGVCYRNYLLKSSSSNEYYLTTPEIGYNQVLYYTVVLPNQFARTLSLEYVYSKTSKHGFRMSYGKQYGGYLSYKWGDYHKKGVNIDNINQDYNVAGAEMVGYIRTSITAGLRIGLLKDLLYLLVGGGYGEYGRQWENNYMVESSTYFYSDYLKGFEGEVSFQCNLFDWVCCSVGTDMVMSKGKISTDYQIGVGIVINTHDFIKHN